MSVVTCRPELLLCLPDTNKVDSEWVPWLNRRMKGLAAAAGMGSSGLASVQVCSCPRKLCCTCAATGMTAAQCGAFPLRTHQVTGPAHPPQRPPASCSGHVLLECSRNSQSTSDKQVALPSGSTQPYACKWSQHCCVSRTSQASSTAPCKRLAAARPCLLSRVDPS